MQKVAAPKAWKTLANEQISDDLIWEITRNWNCYLVGNHNTQFSRDPLNLTGLNTKKDSGLANTKALGVGFEITERKVQEKKNKKKTGVVRFVLNIKTHKQLPKKRTVAIPAKALALHNNTVFSSRRRLALRAVVKAAQRDLTQYRRDLVPVLFKRLRKLNKFRKLHKKQNRLEAKKTKL